MCEFCNKKDDVRSNEKEVVLEKKFMSEEMMG